MSQPSTASLRPVIRVTIVAFVLAAGLVSFLTWAASHNAPVVRGAYVESYDGRVLHDGLEILIVEGDGQAFAELARDPLLRRPEQFGTKGEAAYRAQRPLLGYLAWASSFGQPGWVPPALAVWEVIGLTAAVAAVGAHLASAGRSTWPALLVLLLPGPYVTATFFGPENLVLGLALFALVLWRRPNPPLALIVLLLTAAVLGRETAAIFPVALLVCALARRHWRQAVMLTIPVLVLTGWILVVHARVGAWPTDAGAGRAGPPFSGMFKAMSEWDLRSGETAYLAVLVVLAAYALVELRPDLKLVVLGHLGLAAVLGYYVWINWEFFSRVLLPIHALGLIALAQRFLPVAEPLPVDDG